MDLQTEYTLLYSRIERELEHLVCSGQLKKGDPIPGERKLAAQFQVSRGTLRVALKTLVKRNYLVRIQGKGTFIRDNGISLRNIRIGFVFPEPEISLLYQNYSHYAISSEIWRGIVESCAAKGISALFIPVSKPRSPEENQALFERIKRDCSAVIFPENCFSELADMMRETGFPFCFVTNEAPAPHVFYDREKAVTLAARNMLAAGCRSVTLLDYGTTSEGIFSWETKCRIFRREFAEAGYPLTDKNFIRFVCDERHVLKNLREILPEKGCLSDWYFTTTPILSFVLLHLAAERQWRIPEEIQIFGYANNMAMHRTFPELTHIRLPHDAIGRTAVEILCSRLSDGTEIPEETLLEAELIQGETTK